MLVLNNQCIEGTRLRVVACGEFRSLTPLGFMGRGVVNEDELRIAIQVLMVGWANGHGERMDGL